MKYIISENRMTKLVAKFLNDYDWYDWDSTGDGDVVVYDNVDDKKLFYTGFNEYSSETGEPQFTLWINREFFDDVLSKFFNETLNPMDIVKWFNNRFNINCVDYDFFYPEDDEF